MAREFSNLQTVQKSRGCLRFRLFFVEIDRVAPNFFFPEFSRRRKNLRVAEKLSLRPNKPSPPIELWIKSNDFPGVLMDRPPGMIIKSLGVSFTMGKAHNDEVRSFGDDNDEGLPLRTDHLCIDVPVHWLKSRLSIR